MHHFLSILSISNLWDISTLTMTFILHSTPLNRIGTTLKSYTMKYNWSTFCITEQGQMSCVKVIGHILPIYSNQLWSTCDLLYVFSIHTFMPRLRKGYWPVFESGLKCTIMTFRPLRNDSTKSFLWYVVYVIPKKLHAKKDKSYWSVFEIIYFLTFSHLNPC